MAQAQHHRELSDKEVAAIKAVKDAEAAFLGVLDDAALLQPSSSPRERALARTNIEQAAFWAVRSITG